MRPTQTPSTFSYVLFGIIALATGAGICALIIRGGSLAYHKVFPATQNASSVELHLDEITTTTSKTKLQNATISATSAVQSGVKTLQGRLINEVIDKPANVNLRVTAFAYSAIDLDTGKILLKKNDTLQFQPASVTKLVTAIVAQDVFGPSDSVTISQAALNTEGNSAKLRLNEKYKVDEILYPLLMVSSNDAAEAIARSYGRAKFVQAMNKKVLAMGVKNTYFEDPSGLSAQNLTTASDMAKIAKWIYENRKSVFDMTRVKVKTIKKHTWVNPTHFLNLSSYLGGKNGYTDEAEKTAVSVFTVTTKNGIPHKVAVVTLQSTNRDEDTMAIVKYLENTSW